MPTSAQTMLYHVDPARRPRESHSVAMSTGVAEQAIFFLRHHAITLSAADGVNATSPMAIGRALEAQLAVPEHQLRVTAHHPEHYLVIFNQPAHHDNAVRRGPIRVDGAVFTIAPWHEHDHASFDTLSLHVRVVIEKVPMQYWSLEGAEEILGKKVRVDRLDSRTLERGHTKTFACWLWTRDVAHIPTKHTLWVLPRGAGRVEEMQGFSPPDRRVAPSPGAVSYTMLIHVDRVEDWTPLSPRSSHSGQSGLLSSDSDGDDRPFPMVAPGTWTMEVEDGQRAERQQRLARAPVADLGCRGMPRGGPGRDQDGAGGSGGGGRRSWKDTLLRRGRTPAPQTQPPAPRRRSRSPPAKRRSKGPRGRRHDDRRSSMAPQRHDDRRRSTPPPPPPPPAPAGSGKNGKDPVEDFFKQAKRPLLASVVVDCMAADVQAVADAAVVAPLDFNDGQQVEEGGRWHSQMRSAPCCLALRRPSASSTATPLLRRAPWSSSWARPSAPPKSRAESVPSRQSARQAALVSSVPVAQRASLRIVKELGLLGPKQKMSPEVAEALIRRFDEPLTDNDIAVIAKLTRLDVSALRVAAAMAGPEGAAEEAVV
ncbi:hypothetical protein VPH35_027455 [Triticum aestivum]